MKYFYKIIKTTNYKHRRVIHVGKNFKKINQLYQKYIDSNKNINFSKSKISDFFIEEESILLVTDNPFMQGVGVRNNLNVNILRKEYIKTERLFYCYPEKKYISLDVYDFNDYDTIYIFLNKIIIENSKKTIVIICENVKDAKQVHYKIVNFNKNLLSLGVLTKKNRKKYSSKIMENTKIAYRALYKSYN